MLNMTLDDIFTIKNALIDKINRYSYDNIDLNNSLKYEEDEKEIERIKEAINFNNEEILKMEKFYSLFSKEIDNIFPMFIHFLKG